MLVYQRLTTSNLSPTRLVTFSSRHPALGPARGARKARHRRGALRRQRRGGEAAGAGRRFSRRRRGEANGISQIIGLLWKIMGINREYYG